ncbi:MAG: murein hydrolase activator EnvC family protein [Solirubrobacteraceae bacterium]
MRLARKATARLVLVVLLSLTGAFVGTAGPARAADLSGQLAARQAQAGALRAKIGSENHRLAIVQGSVAVVEARLSRVEADLAGQQARLAATEAALRRERAHLAALELQLARADRALAANLRSQYESDPPDAITVILRSHGFADLLDRLEFVGAAKQHDAQLISADRVARTVVIAAADRLGALDKRQQVLTAAILGRRNDIDRIRLSLVDRAIRIEGARSANAASLAQAESQRSRLVAQIARLQAAAQAPASSGGGGGGGSIPVAGNLLRGGGIVFPLPGGAASPPGTWSLDDGVDIMAAGNTPLLAIGSGTIVLHGIGGFGPDAPVLHLDDGRFVYYGHAGPGNAVAIGTHVSAGQVISEVGAGIVGISTGPHLEIGFADGNGTPLGPGTASSMQSLLLGAYH